MLQAHVLNFILPALLHSSDPKPQDLGILAINVEESFVAQLGSTPECPHQEGPPLAGDSGSKALPPCRLERRPIYKAG